MAAAGQQQVVTATQNMVVKFRMTSQSRFNREVNKTKQSPCTYVCMDKAALLCGLSWNLKCRKYMNHSSVFQMTTKCPSNHSQTTIKSHEKTVKNSFNTRCFVHGTGILFAPKGSISNITGLYLLWPASGKFPLLCKFPKSRFYPNMVQSSRNMCFWKTKAAGRQKLRQRGTGAPIVFYPNPRSNMLSVRVTNISHPWITGVS